MSILVKSPRWIGFSVHGGNAILPRSVIQSTSRGLTSGDGEKNIPFSKIKDIQHIEDIYGNVCTKKIRHSIRDSFSLSVDAAEAITKRIAPALASSVSCIRLEGEKPLSFLIYEILKEFILIGRGHSTELNLGVVHEGDISLNEGFVSGDDDDVTTADPVVDGTGVDSTDDITEEQQNLWMSHETFMDELGKTSRGGVEFVVYDGPKDASKMRAVFKVKRTAPFFSGIHSDPALFQLFAELLSAVHHNSKYNDYDGYVGGALTDGPTWLFCRARRNPDEGVGGYVIEVAKKPINFMTFINEPRCILGSNQSIECMENIFHILYPRILSIDGPTVDAHFQSFEKDLRVLSDDFLQSVMEEKLSRQKLHEELKANKEEIEKLKQGASKRGEEGTSGADKEE
jgi:hypothetical protein